MRARGNVAQKYFSCYLRTVDGLIPLAKMQATPSKHDHCNFTTKLWSLDRFAVRHAPSNHCARNAPAASSSRPCTFVMRQRCFLKRRGTALSSTPVLHSAIKARTNRLSVLLQRIRTRFRRPQRTRVHTCNVRVRRTIFVGATLAQPLHSRTHRSRPCLTTNRRQTNILLPMALARVFFIGRVMS